MEMEEISLSDILEMLKEHWKFIAAITILLMFAASIVTVFFMDKEYSSYTTLMIGQQEGFQQDNANANYNTVLTNQKLVGTYSEIAKSNTVMTEVINRLGLNMSTSQLAGMIEVTSVNDTELIKIAVTCDDPEEAARIADTTAQVFMNNITELMKINNLQVVDPAQVNTNPVSPNLKMNLAIAFLLGIVLSVFIVFIREMLNTNLRSVEELEAMINGIPVVAVIPHADELMSERTGGKK